MRVLTLDVETTTRNKGNPFDKTNKLVCIGTKFIDEVCKIEYDSFMKINVEIKQADLVVGFNIKFDLHWLRKVGYNIEKIKIWDCQIAEFILSCQENKFPSLDGTLLKYGLPPKLDVVKTEYWDKGIDTIDIPRPILSEYLERDLTATEEVFKRQWEAFHTSHKELLPLFKLCCQDLLVLEEMEFNGVVFNTKKALRKAEEIDARIKEIKSTMDKMVWGIPYSLTSDYDVSSILYGGVILEECRIPVGVYKTGDKIGQVRYKLLYKPYELPRMVVPLKGTESHEKVSKKELDYVEKGILKEARKYWQVNEDTLKKLKVKGTAKEFITNLIEYNKLEKLHSTYLVGWSNLIKKMNWEDDMLHSQLNQCIAITGRLSSSNPNGQNADKETKRYCESRYE